MHRPNLGLVLEGGAMRGLYTAGVLDVFLEQGIAVDGVIGVSAGTVHGVSYVSGQHGRSIRYYEKYRSDKRFMGLYPLLTTGDIVDKTFCYEDIPWRLDPFDNDAFVKAGTPFYVTCTNVETGNAEYIRCTDFKGTDAMEYLRAGASMPLVSRIVEVGGKKLLDGGVADPIPLAAFRRMGYERNIVVLTRPAGYRKKPASPLPFQTVYHSYPAFVQAMADRHAVYNREVAAAECGAADGSVLLLRPSTDLNISRTERSVQKLRQLYELGRSDTLARLGELKHFCQK